MIRTGKCPHCNLPINHVVVEPVDIYEGITPRFSGMSLICPKCHKILQVTVDPFMIKELTAETVVKKLKGPA